MSIYLLLTPLWKVVPNLLHIYVNLFTTYTILAHHYNSLNTNNNISHMVHLTHLVPVLFQMPIFL